MILVQWQLSDEVMRVKDNVPEQRLGIIPQFPLRVSQQSLCGRIDLTGGWAISIPGQRETSSARQQDTRAKKAENKGRLLHDVRPLTDLVKRADSCGAGFEVTQIQRLQMFLRQSLSNASREGQTSELVTDSHRVDGPHMKPLSISDNVPHHTHTPALQHEASGGFRLHRTNHWFTIGVTGVPQW